MYYSEFVSLEIAFIFYKDIFEEKICINALYQRSVICYKKIYACSERLLAKDQLSVK